jgi:hypothetical protein
MPRRNVPQPLGPDWLPEQTLRALRKQLESLQKLKGRSHREAGSEETEWGHLTEGVLLHGFGEDSRPVRNFHMTRWAGEHNVMGVSEGQQQRNFDLRMEQA